MNQERPWRYSPRHQMVPPNTDLTENMTGKACKAVNFGIKDKSAKMAKIISSPGATKSQVASAVAQPFKQMNFVDT